MDSSFADGGITRGWEEGWTRRTSGGRERMGRAEEGEDRETRLSEFGDQPNGGSIVDSFGNRSRSSKSSQRRRGRGMSQAHLGGGG